MRQSVSTVRVLSYALLAVAVAAGTTGCFKRGVKGDYALAPEMRPLEVPPDLNLPTTTGDNKVPTLASATKPAAPAAAARPWATPVSPSPVARTRLSPRSAPRWKAWKV
jgi:Uncharacterized lipoprotein